MAALIVLVIFIVQTIAEKRILLNDPSLLQSQVHVLERKVEDVLGKFTDLSVKYADLSTKYNDISTKNNDQSAKYNDLSTKYNDLSNKFTDLTTKYNDQSTKYNDLSTKYNTLLTKTNGLFLRVTLKIVTLHGIIHERSITILSFKLLNIVSKYQTENQKVIQNKTDFIPHDNACKRISPKYQKVHSLINIIIFVVGGIFVRWGRKDCPANNTELVYSGQYVDRTGVEVVAEPIFNTLFIDQFA